MERASNQAVAGEPGRTPTRRLGNGLLISIVVDGEPSMGNLAVCPSDEAGRPGPLNERVLRAAGLNPADLPHWFRPPATLQERGRFPVLAVQVMEAGQGSAALLERSLRAGLALLPSFQGSTLWLPLLGTGAANLTPGQSAAAIVRALEQWEGGAGATAVLSVSEPATAELLAQDWEALSPGTWVPQGIVVWLRDDDRTEPVELMADEGLAGTLARAVWLGNRRPGNDPHKLSFSSLLGAFVTAGEEDALGAWFRGYALEAGVALGPLLERFRGLDADPVRLSRDQIATLLSGSQRRTTSARAALEEAQRIRDAVTGPQAPLAVRHLMAAFIALPHYHDSDFRDLKLDRRLWCRAFCAHAQQLYPDEGAFWRDFEPRVFPDGDTPPPPTPPPPTPPLRRERGKPGYGSDWAGGDDLLDVKDDVRALCSVIAARDAEPPLSIGLFGDWGTGKTFFMREMSKWLDTLKQEQRRQQRERPGAPSAYCANIVQLWFNAWHYTDANLWANLAEEIFEGLGRALESDAALRAGVPTAEQAKALLVAAASSARDVLAEAEKNKELAEADRTAVEKSIDTLEEQKSEIERNLGKGALVRAAYRTIVKKPEVRQSLDDAARALRIPEAKRKGTELQAQLAELRGLAGAVRGMWLSLKSRPVELGFWGVTLVGAVPVAAYFLPDAIRALTSGALPKGTGAVIAAATWVVGFAGRYLPGVKRTVDLMKQVFQSRSAEIETAQAARKKQLEDDRRRVLDRLQGAEKQRQAAEQRVQEVDRQLASLRFDRKMSDFIHERRESSDYRQHLGVVARARRDFKSLSELLKGAVEEGAQPADATAPKKGDDRLHIDRIVLYIDDLDRCPEDKVVDVLQAVHLLLAFPLFVVVVGVDSRWLLHSLKQRVGALREDTGDDGADGLSDEERLHWQSTPLSYLEKIFQIPLALHPMSSTGFERLIDKLAPAPPPPPKEGPAVVVTPDPSAAGKTLPEKVAVKPDAGGGKLPPAAPSEPGKTPPVAPAVPPPAPALDLNPENLQISEDERIFIKHLFPLMPSPRATKRFVNVYRLMRATVSDTDWPAFLDQGGYRAVLLLLAILVGHPLQATDLLRDLIEDRPKEAFWPFLKSYRRRTKPEPAPDGSAEADRDAAAARLRWTQFLDKVEPLEKVLKFEAPCSLFTTWAPRVARYSFESGRVLYTRAVA